MRLSLLLFVQVFFLLITPVVQRVTEVDKPYYQAAISILRKYHGEYFQNPRHFLFLVHHLENSNIPYHLRMASYLATYSMEHLPMYRFVFEHHLNMALSPSPWPHETYFAALEDWLYVSRRVKWENVEPVVLANPFWVVLWDEAWQKVYEEKNKLGDMLREMRKFLTEESEQAKYARLLQAKDMFMEAWKEGAREHVRRTGRKLTWEGAYNDRSKKT